MKVIKRGQIPEEKVIRTDCDNCDSVIEFTRGEAKRISDQRDGDYYSIKCPVCGRDINVSTKV